MDEVEARRFLSIRPEATPGPGDDSRDSDRPSLSGDLEWTERLPEWFRFVLVDTRAGDPDLDIGRVKVTSDLLRLRPPRMLAFFCALQSI